MTVKLSAATLASLPANVARPRYDRSALKAGIVHFGVGNFHRAHQAVYLDDLFSSGAGHDWRWSAPACSRARRPAAQGLRSRIG